MAKWALKQIASAISRVAFMYNALIQPKFAGNPI
jgi:hypothetical protein